MSPEEATVRIYLLAFVAAAMAAGCASPGGRAERGGGAESPETAFGLHPIGHVETTNGQTFIASTPCGSRPTAAASSAANAGA